MPNYVTSKMSIVGPNASEIRKSLFIDGEFTFSAIVPMPEGYQHLGNISFRAEDAAQHFAAHGSFPEGLSEGDRKQAQQMLELFKEHGYWSWYDWSCSKWGTKWDACESWELDDGVWFDTAWSMPDPYFRALSEKYPDVEIHVVYADEDLGSNCGEVHYKGGVPIHEYFPEGKEALAFALDVKGMDPDDFDDEGSEYE